MEIENTKKNHQIFIKNIRGRTGNDWVRFDFIDEKEKGKKCAFNTKHLFLGYSKIWDTFLHT